MKYYFAVLIAFISHVAIAQELAGEIYGSGNIPLPGAAVVIQQSGSIKGFTATDTSGQYLVKMEPGDFDIIVGLKGYDSVIFTKVNIAHGERTTLNMKLRKTGEQPEPRKVIQCTLGLNGSSVSSANAVFTRENFFLYEMMGNFYFH